MAADNYISPARGIHSLNWRPVSAYPPGLLSWRRRRTETPLDAAPMVRSDHGRGSRAGAPRWNCVGGRPWSFAMAGQTVAIFLVRSYQKYGTSHVGSTKFPRQNQGPCLLACFRWFLLYSRPDPVIGGGKLWPG